MAVTNRPEQRWTSWRCVKVYQVSWVVINVYFVIIMPNDDSQTWFIKWIQHILSLCKRSLGTDFGKTRYLIYAVVMNIRIAFCLPVVIGCSELTKCVNQVTLLRRWCPGEKTDQPIIFFEKRIDCKNTESYRYCRFNFRINGKGLKQNASYN